MNQHLTRILPLCSMAAVLLAQGVVAQRTYPQDKMKANYAEMLTHPWYTGGGWTTDFAAAKAKAKETGKPANVIEKMVEGRLQKFFKEQVLLKQQFVVDPDNTVEKAVEAAAKEAGEDIQVTGFVRFALGECYE